MSTPKLRLLLAETETGLETRPEESLSEVEPSFAFVLRLREGEPDALRTLYLENHRGLRRLGRRLLGNVDDAEDLLHEVFLALPQALRRYRGECTLRAFLTSIALKRASKRLRGLGRFRRAIAQLAHRSETDRDDEESRGDSAELRQLAGMLSDEILRLSFPQRAVVVLCLVEERSAIEVAGLLGIPESTVRTRLFYARQQLRERLKDHR
jgi:RNA polymerase sigma-70 factor, ECF subfamily